MWYVICLTKLSKNPNGTWTQKRVNLKGERGGRSFRKENATIRARAYTNSNKP